MFKLVKNQIIASKFFSRQVSLKRYLQSTHRYLNSSTTNLNQRTVTKKNDVELLDSNDPEVFKLMENYMILKENFITEDEEKSLLAEIDPYMKRLRYEFDHWDDAIHGYRETERLNWNDNNQKILEKVKKFAFDSFTDVQPTNLLNHIHILDLHEDGYIKPHVDAVRFCGNTIAGISLLSDAVMKLTYEKDKTKSAHALLKRRSLYIMREAVRYEYAHEVLKNSESFFKNKQIKKTRRISIICRNQPDLETHPESTK